MKKLLLIFSSVLLLASCEKQSELVTIMEIDNVAWHREYIPSGTNLHFLIDAESQSSTIQRVAIMASDMMYRDRLILDTVFAMPVKRQKLSFYYTLPYYEDTTVISFNAHILVIISGSRAKRLIRKKGWYLPTLKTTGIRLSRQRPKKKAAVCRDSLTI